LAVWSGRPLLRVWGGASPAADLFLDSSGNADEFPEFLEFGIAIEQLPARSLCRAAF